MPKLLIIDNERGSREAMRLIFSRDYTVKLAATADEALEVLARDQVDLVLLDVVMPGHSGVDLLRRIHTHHPEVPVIMVSASNTPPPVAEALRQGAFDFIDKPFDVTNIRHVVNRSIEINRLHRQLAVLETEWSAVYPTGEIVGRSPAFLSAIAQLTQAAETEGTVLIQGERGTGKELAARLLHAKSARCNEPFVAIRSTALPDKQLESDLFGHEKGTLHHADQQKKGRLELAESGTLFFDEIGDMPLATQGKIVRVLEEREFMRIGGNRHIRTSARLLVSTSRDLRREAAEGRFRDDLYRRLTVIQVGLPPLRERRDDIPLLLEHFLSRLGPALHATVRGFDAEALHQLREYRWPGNVRELRNVVECMLVLHGQESEISASLLPGEFHPDPARADAMASPPPLPASGPVSGEGLSLEAAVHAYERQLIADSLRHAGGVQTRAAEKLGTTRRILRYKMAKLGLADMESPADG